MDDNGMRRLRRRMPPPDVRVAPQSEGQNVETVAVERLKTANACLATGNFRQASANFFHAAVAYTTVAAQADEIGDSEASLTARRGAAHAYAAAARASRQQEAKDPGTTTKGSDGIYTYAIATFRSIGDTQMANALSKEADKEYASGHREAGNHGRDEAYALGLSGEHQAAGHVAREAGFSYIKSNNKDLAILAFRSSATYFWLAANEHERSGNHEAASAAMWEYSLAKQQENDLQVKRTFLRCSVGCAGVLAVMVIAILYRLIS